MYPVARNQALSVELPLTPEKLAAKYNNFYEFAPDKRIAQRSQRLDIDPWTGFPLRKPLDWIEPLPEARYVRFETFYRPSQALYQAVGFWQPWKYGFKSIKSIVKIELTDEQPKRFQNEIAPNEYERWVAPL